MKHLLFALMLIATPTYAKDIPNLAQNPETELKNDKIYFFAHSLCSSCKDAFVYLETRHKELNIPITDMKHHHNLELYKQCVAKFNIPNQELTLPLICIGNNYVMGWNNQTSPTQFEQALEEFK
ncbi:MAG: hypothetical protein NC218_10520 [Acetobacter sp.]|nr:hypothetical protein [Acetobacter sp.]